LDEVSFASSKSEVTIFFSKHTSFTSLSLVRRERKKNKKERREEKIKRKGYSKKRYIS